MTKKDFILIANVLNEGNASLELIEAFARALQFTNAGFDSEKFVKACHSLKESKK